VLSVAYYASCGLFESVLPQFVRDRLDGDAVTYSMLWVLFGAGTLAALPLAPRRRSWPAALPLAPSPAS
jgi:hypothetical protein